MTRFKCGDKVTHPVHGPGTVLNQWNSVSLVQFLPDSNRPNGGPTVYVHPITLTKVLREQDMFPDMYYGRYETGECVQFNATELVDALPEFRVKLTEDENNHYFALWFKPLGDSPIARAEFNGDTGMTYLVTDDTIEEWLAIFKEGL